MGAIRLIFLGPPGSGKGTQAVRLSDELGLTQLSSGDVLRRERKAQSEIGRKAAEYMDAGTLVPDDVITGVMLAAIDRLPAGTGFVLDGFPRTLPQAKTLDAGLEERGIQINAVVDFQLDDEEIIKRIVSRRVCSSCAATYNLEFLPPKVDGKCDKCAGELIQRKDDHREVIATRLETYREQTAPLIEHYSRRGGFQSVDATSGADTVAAAVAGIVKQSGG